jgi:hypothetical protein
MHHTVSEERFSFELGAAKSSAVAYRAEGSRATLVLGHGAGAPQAHPWMVAMARAIAARGVEVVTFNFLYAEAKKKAPDRNDVLEATWRAVLAKVRVPGRRLFVGGKSMGGRIASQVAAHDDVDVAGVVLLGYPLHPPGKPEQLRTKHLPGVRAPMLFVQGSRDPFGGPGELAPLVAQLGGRARLFAVDGGDHSLVRPKSSGETPAATMARVADEVVRFVASP